MLLNPKIKPIQSQKVLNFLNRMNCLEDFLAPNPEEQEPIIWVLDGPTETVKTWTDCLFLYLLHLKVPGLQSIMLRNEQTNVYRTVLKTLVQHILPFGLDKRDDNPVVPYGGTKTPDHLNFRNGGKMFMGGEDIANKVLGTEWDVAYYSQCEESDKEFWEKLSGRCTGRSGALTANGKPIGILLGECNPDHDQHHLKKAEEEGRLEMISFTHKDNPMIFYDGEFTDYGRRTLSGLRKRYSGVNLDRLYHGKWGSAEGLVYEDYDPKVHVKDIRWGDIPENYKIITGRDYGTQSPFAHLAFAYSPDKSELLELPNTQIYMSRKETAEIGEWILQIEKEIFDNLGKNVSIRVADHDAQGQLVLEKMHLKADLADKEKLIGIEEVKTRLKNRSITFNANSLWHPPDIELSDRPQELAQEWRLYRYKDRKAQLKNPDKADEPMKGNDHGLDVVRYICMALGQFQPAAHHFDPIIVDTKSSISVF